MFERTFEEMSARVFVEEGAAEIAARYGMGEISPGDNEVSSTEALALARKFDQLQAGVPKRLQKRWRALRNQFVFAFGPELEERLAS